MKWLNELLGFAALSAGYLVLLAWLPIAIWVAVKLAKRFKSRATRIAGGLGLFLLFFVLPFGDEIAGKFYLAHLCSTEERVKVYRTVELPADYWDEQGKPKYLGANGFVDMKLLPSQFKWHNIDEPYIDSTIKIRRRRWQLLDGNTQTVLGERITYMRYFGWMNRFSPAPNIGEGCAYLGGQTERDQEQKFFSEIFRPTRSTR